MLSFWYKKQFLKPMEIQIQCFSESHLQKASKNRTVTSTEIPCNFLKKIEIKEGENAREKIKPQILISIL